MDDFLDAKEEKEKAEKPSTTVPGTVEKIIPSPDPREPEKAEIVLHDGDPLYREIRIENTLQNGDGEEVGLKPGAPVHVTVEATAKIRSRKIKNDQHRTPSIAFSMPFAASLLTSPWRAVGESPNAQLSLVILT